MVCPKALVAIQGISRNVFRHAVSEIEMVETVLDHERAFEIILDHARARWTQVTMFHRIHWSGDTQVVRSTG